MTFNHLQTIIQQVDEVRRTFESAGKKIYLVGGIVRDLYGNATNIQNLDIDLTTNATPEEIKAIIKPIADNLWLSGEKFGTIGAHVNGKTIEKLKIKPTIKIIANKVNKVTINLASILIKKLSYGLFFNRVSDQPI